MRIVRGSAIMEGVCLATMRWRVAAVRRKDGTIGVASGETGHELAHALPFVRGMFTNLVEATPELEWSMEEPLAKELPSPSYRSPVPTLSLHVAANAVPIFIVWPLVKAVSPSSFAYQVALGVVQVAMYVTYFVGMRRASDLQRLFGYAGALKRALWWVRDPDTELRALPSWHPRSTAFLVAIANVLVGIAATLVLPRLDVEGRLPTFLVRLALTLPALGVADELTRLLEHLGRSAVVRTVFAPFVALDRVATAEPEPAMLEVAAVAVGKLAELEIAAR